MKHTWKGIAMFIVFALSLVITHRLTTNKHHMKRDVVIASGVFSDMAYIKNNIYILSKRDDKILVVKPDGNIATWRVPLNRYYKDTLLEINIRKDGNIIAICPRSKEKLLTNPYFDMAMMAYGLFNVNNDEFQYHMQTTAPDDIKVIIMNPTNGNITMRNEYAISKNDKNTIVWKYFWKKDGSYCIQTEDMVNTSNICYTEGIGWIKKSSQLSDRKEINNILLENNSVSIKVRGDKEEGVFDEEEGMFEDIYRMKHGKRENIIYTTSLCEPVYSPIITDDNKYLIFIKKDLRKYCKDGMRGLPDIGLKEYENARTDVIRRRL